MSPVERAPWLLPLIARLLLRLHGRPFRHEVHADYLEAVDHRWSREAAAGPGAAWRTLTLLVADAIRSVPASRRSRRRAGYGSSGAEALLADARLAARSVVRRPRMAALVVTTLALGIGSSTAIFGVLDRYVLRPLPFDDADRMVYLAMRGIQTGFTASPTQGLLDRWRTGSRTLEAIEVFRTSTATRSDDDGGGRLSRFEVSAGLPAMVGASPVLGRALGPADAAPDATPALMVDEAFWRRELGGDPDVVGSTLTLEDSAFAVVGVWPSWAVLDPEDRADVWTVLPSGAEADPSRFTRVLALRIPGAGADAVQAELARLFEGLDEPRYEGRYAPAVLPLHGFLGRDFVTGLWVTWAGVLLLLLVAVVNAATVLLNRAVTRSAEIGVRLAIGGSGRALVRLFLTESVLLSALGALAGLLLARVGALGLAAAAPDRFPDFGGAAVSARSMVLGVVLAGVAALSCGLVPALHLRSHRVRSLLGREGGRPRRGRLSARQALVSLQVALAMVLVVGSSLGLRSLRSLLAVDPGFDLDPLVVAAIRLPRERYPENADRATFWREATEAFRTLPGVEHVAVSGVPPFRFSINPDVPYVEGEEPPPATGGWASQASASPGYFEAMGITLLEGRGARVGDEDGETRVVVNRTFAERYPGSVLGRRIAFREGGRSMRIVGVAQDVRAHGLADGEARVQYWVLDEGASGTYSRFLLRAASDPELLLNAVRSRLHDLDPTLTLASATTGKEILRGETENERFLAVLLGAFGTLSLMVALLGVWGSVTLSVNQRTRELGVRRALGAASGAVVKAVLLTGARPVVLGVLAGAAGAALLGRFVSAALYGVPPNDPISFAAGAAALALAGALACVAPSRRALRVDPVRVLKSE